MSTSIYYFTGTGNSLHVARAVAEQLGESKLINIARQKGNGIIEDKGDTVGIVFPVYYANMPVVVKDFVKKLRLDPQAYVFGIATAGGTSAGFAHRTLDRLLKTNGGHLSASFLLTMPDNAYIGINLVTPPEQRDPLIKASEDAIKRIVDVLKNREKAGAIRGKDLMEGSLGWFSSTYGYKIYRLPRRFKATGKCNGCGICEKLCPAGNITRSDKKVTWGNNCTHCLACFHWCPQAAIEIGDKSASIARYHHPAIKVGDLVK